MKTTLAETDISREEFNALLDDILIALENCPIDEQEKAHVLTWLIP